MTSLQVFACEAQPIVVEGLQRVLDPCADLHLAGFAASLAEATELVHRLRPEVVLVDQSESLKAIFRFVAELKATVPASHPVLWVTDLAEADYFRALQMGARGILRKTLPVPSLLECLRAVGGGHIWIEHAISNQVVGFLNRKSSPRLTPRERDIVRFVCRGMKNKQIAELLRITPGTVKVHLMHIFEKTGFKDRYELAIHGRKLFGIDLETEGFGVLVGEDA